MTHKYIMNINHITVICYKVEITLYGVHKYKYKTGETIKENE